MPVEKKYLKLGVAGLAVVALVIGLSVGLTQKNKADDRSAASNVKANNNIASEAGDTCRTFAKGGKSGRRERRLVVPGAEDADARREELRGALQRELGTDDGMAGGTATMNRDGDGDGNGGKNGGGGGGRGNQGNNANKPGRPGRRPGKGNNRPGGGGNKQAQATADDYDYDYYYGYYYYGYDYDYGYGYGYGKSGKSGNKAGKSGGYGDVCLPVYDPCDPDATPNPDPCYGKSGKSGSPGCGKSGKSGNKSGKSGGMYDYCPCDPCYGKSGKSGSPQCGKSGKSGNKSGKSGNKSGKSGNKSGKSGGYGTCDCMPTLCPTPPCVCEDLPFAFVGGVCTQKCGVSEDGPYADQGACCLANFPPGAGNCQVDACVETPSPTYNPTAVQPTYNPTAFEPLCVCEDLPWIYRNGVCRRGCGISENGPYNTRKRCCIDNFNGSDGADCLTDDTCCDCEMLPYAFVNNRCVRGCGLSEDGAYNTMSECCNNNFGAGTGNGNSCSRTDECPMDPTPSPTAGSTPTVSTEATGPPTKPGREGI